MQKALATVFACATLSVFAQDNSKEKYSGPEGQTIKATGKGDVCMRAEEHSKIISCFMLDTLDPSIRLGADRYFFIGSNISEDVLMQSGTTTGFDIENVDHLNYKGTEEEIIQLVEGGDFRFYPDYLVILNEGTTDTAELVIDQEEHLNDTIVSCIHHTENNGYAGDGFVLEGKIFSGNNKIPMAGYWRATGSSEKGVVFTRMKRPLQKNTDTPRIIKTHYNYKISMIDKDNITIWFL